ncbi:MAG: ThuA domain-containing protein [Anaerolineales bacterium]|nr:ThuA domain-containing protein [Anaerolineales bacterium]
MTVLKILVLCDDRWHPARVLRDGLGALAGRGFVFDWLEDARHWSLERMARYSVVVLAKSNHFSSADETAWMTDQVQMAFLDYIRRGNGLLAVHSGTAGYAETLMLRNLLGGVFDHHPEACPVTFTPLPGHPLTQGVAPFTVTDEHYFMSMSDPHVEVFLTSRSAHGEQPAGWRRQEGTGRIAVLTPGHTPEIWQSAGFQTLLGNCLRWCGGRIA